MKLCLIEDCTQPSHRRGLCSPHYSSHRYRGTIDDVAPKAYRHWITNVNPDTREATCSACGDNTPVVPVGKDRHGGQKFRCKSAVVKAPYVYAYADGESIPQPEIDSARAKLQSEQAGHCAICNRHESVVGALRLDHCHSTGKIRGLLCNGCNVGLGLFKDSPETLIAASEYLSR